MLLQDYPYSRDGSSEASQSLQRCSVRRELLLCKADGLRGVQDFWRSIFGSYRPLSQMLREPYFYLFLASKMDYSCRFINFYFVLSSVIRVLSEINSNSI